MQPQKGRTNFTIHQVFNDHWNSELNDVWIYFNLTQSYYLESRHLDIIYLIFKVQIYYILLIVINISRKTSSNIILLWLLHILLLDVYHGKFHVFAEIHSDPTPVMRVDPGSKAGIYLVHGSQQYQNDKAYGWTIPNLGDISYMYPLVMTNIAMV